MSTYGEKHNACGRFPSTHLTINVLNTTRPGTEYLIHAWTHCLLSFRVCRCSKSKTKARLQLGTLIQCVDIQVEFQLLHPLPLSLNVSDHILLPLSLSKSLHVPPIPVGSFGSSASEFQWYHVVIFMVSSQNASQVNTTVISTRVFSIYPSATLLCCFIT